MLTTNSTTYDNIKTKIRNLKPNGFVGQNIEKMAATYIIWFKELEDAG